MINFAKTELLERPMARYGLDWIIIFASDEEMIAFFENEAEHDPEGFPLDFILQSLDVEYVLMTDAEIDSLPLHEP